MVYQIFNYLCTFIKKEIIKSFVNNIWFTFKYVLTTISYTTVIMANTIEY